MENLIEEYKKARKNLIKTIEKVPENKKEEILLDEWSLKNLISHLSGWAEYQVDILEEFKKGNQAEKEKGLKNSINIDFVEKRKNLTWNEVYNEFLELSDKLIKSYESLPENLWNKKIYREKDIAAADFIEIEITHYNNTHVPQIKKALNV